MCGHASFDAAIMPTISSSSIPTPKSWDEFEDIVLAAAKLRWNATDFFRNGRQGQKQDGVDVWATTMIATSESNAKIQSTASP
jgi:phosphoglycerol transferase MdoB-like AlkP superfamily enzyme